MATNLYVKLTGSENQFLTYPCFGLLEIIEFGVSGSIVVAVFRVAKDGKLSAPVEVCDAKFEYSPRRARQGHQLVMELRQRQADGARALEETGSKLQA